MKKRPGMLWVPAVVVEELEDLQQEHGLAQRADAFEKMADYARVGREVERIAKFSFYPPTRRPKR